MLIYAILWGCGEPEKEVEPSAEQGDILVDADGDGFLSDEDCDDNDGNIFPSAEEICDGFDNNCNGQADEDVQSTFYADSDGDGFGSQIITTQSCESPEGFVQQGTDCDDTDNLTFPGATEICDNKDNDCNSEIDEGLSITFFVDSDGDGFGDDNNQVEACQPEFGISQIAGDCDDSTADISPIASEICDDIDNNCNEEVDEGVLLTFYLDSDEDGYGDPEHPQEACSAPEGTVDNNEDCNDLETLAHPNFFEICDGVDNNCDNQVDEDSALDTVAFYADFDGDEHGDPNNITYACSTPENHVTTNDDCNDSNNSIYPNANEICDGEDNDCDDETDEEVVDSGNEYFLDADGDTFGDPEISMMACSKPEGYSENAYDCDDEDDDNYLSAP